MTAAPIPMYQSQVVKLQLEEPLLILILTLSVVIGLGIGHFVGWNDQIEKHKQLTMGQILKLKQLQDDLLNCLNQQKELNENKVR